MWVKMFEHTGGQQTMTIKANNPSINWIIETDGSADSWLKISPTSKIGDATITFLKFPTFSNKLKFRRKKT